MRNTLLAIFFGGITLIYGQDNRNSSLVDPGLDAKSNAYMDRQSEEFLNYIDKVNKDVSKRNTIQKVQIENVKYKFCSDKFTYGHEDF